MIAFCILLANHPPIHSFQNGKPQGEVVFVLFSLGQKQLDRRSLSLSNLVFLPYLEEDGGKLFNQGQPSSSAILESASWHSQLLVSILLLVLSLGIRISLYVRSMDKEYLPNVDSFIT